LSHSDKSREQASQLGAVGFEHPTKTPENRLISLGGGAKSSALSIELQKLINRWPELPPAIRAGILAIVNSVEKTVP
jgi:hypothetical protein